MAFTGGTTGDRASRSSTAGGRSGPPEIRDRFGVAHCFSWFRYSGEAPSRAFSGLDDARRFLDGFGRDPWTLAAFYRILGNSVAAGRGPDPARLMQSMAAALAGGSLQVGPAERLSPSDSSQPSLPSRSPLGAALASAIEELASEPTEPPTPRETELTWIEVELVGEDDKPIAGERYRLTLSTGRVLEGSLDAQGRVRIERMTPGTFDLTFPRLDEEAWNRA